MTPDCQSYHDPPSVIVRHCRPAIYSPFVRYNLPMFHGPTSRLCDFVIACKGCVATFRVAGGDVKESRNGNPTGDLQMAADRTRHHPLYCPVVSSLFSFATRC